MNKIIADKCIHQVPVYIASASLMTVMGVCQDQGYLDPRQKLDPSSGGREDRAMKSLLCEKRSS